MTEAKVSIEHLRSLLHLSGLRVEIVDVTYSYADGYVRFQLEGPDAPNSAECVIQYTQSVETKLVPV